MKKIKLLAIMLCVAILTLSFVACGNSETNDPPGVKTFIYETEDIDLTGLSGKGSSNEEKEWGMISGKNKGSIVNNGKLLKSISGGFFLDWFTVTDTVLTFNVVADVAANDNILVLRMATAYGTIPINKNNIEIAVNGGVLDYTEFSVTGERSTSLTEVMYKTPFKDFILNTKFNLKEGNNVITITRVSNDFGLDIDFAGPGIDCIKVKTKANLTWDKLLKDNMDGVKFDQ